MTSCSPPMLKPIRTAARTPAGSDDALDSRKVPSAAIARRTNDTSGAKKRSISQPVARRPARAAPPIAETAMAARSAGMPRLVSSEKYTEALENMPERSVPSRRDGPLFDAQGARRRDAVSVYRELAASTRPLSASEFAERLGLHTNTVRLHLERLREAGLVEVEAVHRGTVGRPQHLTRSRPGARARVRPARTRCWPACSRRS